MHPKFVFLCTGLLVLLFVHKCIGAEITRYSADDSRKDLIVLKGVIQQEDQTKFTTAAAASRKAVVALDSEGGLVLPSIGMGKAIRLKNFATVVGENTLCASACALMWLAGNPRYIGLSAHIGFHAAFIERNGTLMESGQANALIGAYLDRLGLSESAVAFVTSAPPEKIEWLDASKAQTIGVDVVWMRPSSGTTEPSSPGIETSKERYDPVSVVTRFYNALGAADGSTAAALVVPEKRGIGPFNEANMASFFANMR
jgi:hypothetical protein